MPDINTKIANLHTEILEEFQRRNDVLLSLCESPIEKLFLLQILQYYYDQSVETYSFTYIVDNVETIRNPKNSKEQILESHVNFMEKGGCFFLFMKGIQIENSTLKYQILPQYILQLDERTLRLDFAILVEERKKGQIISSFKFCIECEGHDYHSTKSQITKDNERMRILIKYGWTVLRYSGSEIFKSEKSSIEELETILLNSLNRIY